VRYIVVDDGHTLVLSVILARDFEIQLVERFTGQRFALLRHLVRTQLELGELGLAEQGRAQAVEQRPEDVQAVVKSYLDIVDFIKKDETEAVKIMSKVVEQPADAYKAFMPGTRFFDLSMNLKGFEKRSDDDSLYGSGKTISAAALTLRLIVSGVERVFRLKEHGTTARTEVLGGEELMKLHGGLRAKGRAVSNGVELGPGHRVRLKPRPGGDIFDVALAGKEATVSSIEEDYEGRIFLALTIDDDPGRDLGPQAGVYRGLVHDHAASGLADRVAQRIDIERHERSDIDDLRRNAGTPASRQTASSVA